MDKIKSLNKEGLELNRLSTDLIQALMHDLEQRQKSEAIDIAKAVGIMAGLAGFAVTLSRYTFDPVSSHAIAEVSVGAAAGATASFHKEIFSLFKKQGKKLLSVAPKATAIAKHIVMQINNEDSIMIVGKPKRTNKLHKSTQQSLDVA